MLQSVSILFRNISKFKSLAVSGDFDRAILLVVRFFSYKFEYQERVSKLPRPIASWVYFTNKQLVCLVIRVFRYLWPQKYSDADPFKKIIADPNAIKYRTNEPFSKRRGWVVSGDWDSAPNSFSDLVIPAAIYDHYRHCIEWEDSTISEHYDSQRARREGQKIEELYDRIRSEGYKSQRELLRQDSELAWNGLNDTMHPELNEVAVDIGRNGELLWNMCGQHRLAIAQVLDIEKIPVQIFRRHSQWQDIRDRFRDGRPIPDKYEDHPDLQDLH